MFSSLKHVFLVYFARVVEFHKTHMIGSPSEISYYHGTESIVLPAPQTERAEVYEE